jgi:acetolactate synthase-1/2/3 large subunit
MIIQEKDFTKADLIAFFLAKKDVKTVFLLSGGMIAFMADAISKTKSIKLVNVRHEQSAGFAAEGATRVSGIPNVAMATSGPGATNLITSIASSYFDSIPTVFITGQVNQLELKKFKKQRQNGFQELDIVNMVKGITKKSIRINSNHNLFEELNEIWAIALEGRPGPVLLDIPIDVQQEKSDLPPLLFDSPTPNMQNPNSAAKDLVSEIEISQRPLILLGGGIRIAGQSEQIRLITHKLKIPCVYSLMGVDALDSTNEYRVGMIGSYGNRWANQALARCDLLIALGTRLDIRQTGFDVKSFTKDKRIFRVDIDPIELKGRVNASTKMNINLKDFFKDLIDDDDYFKDFTEWHREIQMLKIASPQKNEQAKEVGFNPDDIMRWIGDISVNSRGYFVDVGQHQMWAAQSIALKPGQRFLTSGGLGSMGFALPAGIGASVDSNSSWTIISGDGCSQLSISELQTVKHYNLPLKICIINNNQHGMVAQFQEGNLDGRFVATREDYSCPDFVQVAQAFGISSISFDNLQDLEKNLVLVKNWDKGPLILEFKVPNSAKALPKLGTNGSIHDL